jgi:hypothetical protein
MNDKTCFALSKRLPSCPLPLRPTTPPGESKGLERGDRSPRRGLLANWASGIVFSESRMQLCESFCVRIEAKRRFAPPVGIVGNTPCGGLDRYAEAGMSGACCSVRTRLYGIKEEAYTPSKAWLQEPYPREIIQILVCTLLRRFEESSYSRRMRLCTKSRGRRLEMVGCS